MTISTENAAGPALERPDARRAGREVVLEWVFRPLSNVIVRPLARVGVPPSAVVLANASFGLLAALVLAREELVLAALLLQVKTLLDNADGALARATGRVTLVGRYLDTLADLVVNAAVFAALAVVTGEPLLALAAFVALTLVLAADYNATELYREARGEQPASPARTGSSLERALELAYRVVFGPLDRLARAFSRRRFVVALGGEDRPDATRGARLAYHDSLTVGVLANLGLTTQLAALGVCLVLGVPELYLWAVLGSLFLLPLLQLRRERAVARRLRAA